MKQFSDFDDILNEALERTLVKGESLEQCLLSYPEQASRLRPLLETTLAAGKASAMQPRPEFRERARYQLQAALREKEHKTRRSFIFQPRWATALAIVLVMVLLSSSAVAASGSLPDQPLYPVKLATEQVQLTLTPGALGKAQLYARFSDRRIAEIMRLAREGKAAQIDRAANRIQVYLEKVAILVSARQEANAAPQTPSIQSAPAPSMGGTKGMMPAIANGHRAAFRAMMGRDSMEQMARLRASLQTVPPSARPALLRAIMVSEGGYQQVLQSLGQ